MYDALNHGARRVCAGRWRRCRCPGPGRAGRIVLAVDVTPRCARTLHPAQTGCFATSTAAGRGQAQSIPGWLYSFVAAIEPGWTSWSALLDAIRLDPAEDATALTAEQLRGQPASPPRGRSPGRTAEPTETTAEPTASEESNSDAERGADATTGAPENSPSSDAGNLDATSPVTPRPPGPPVAATRRARAAVRAARAPSAPRRDDLLATVRRPPVWSVVHAGSSIVQFGG